MDDRLLRRLSEVMDMQEQLRERCAAIIVPQLLTNMLLLDILDELKELNKVKLNSQSCQCETSEEEPKKTKKAMPTKRKLRGEK